jgi:hypothetical protein
MSRSAPHDHQALVVEVRGPGEWIVGVRTGGRRLHVYRVADDDWLVSEVGLRNEGRGADIARAINALGEVGPDCDWWHVVPAALKDAIRG